MSDMANVYASLLLSKRIIEGTLGFFHQVGAREEAEARLLVIDRVLSETTSRISSLDAEDKQALFPVVSLLDEEFRVLKTVLGYDNK